MFRDILGGIRSVHPSLQQAARNIISHSYRLGVFGAVEHKVKSSVLCLPNSGAFSGTCGSRPSALLLAKRCNVLSMVPGS